MPFEERRKRRRQYNNGEAEQLEKGIDRPAELPVVASVDRQLEEPLIVESPLPPYEEVFPGRNDGSCLLKC